jgi:hypothetical protein
MWGLTAPHITKSIVELKHQTIVIVILAYILNLFAPIVNPLGVIALCGCFAYGDLSVLPIAGVMAILGLVFGILAHRNDIPPRWFWSKSRNEIFSFSVSAVLGYAWNFAAWPLTIYLVQCILDAM